MPKKIAIDLRAGDAADLKEHFQGIEATGNLYDGLLLLALRPVVERLHQHSLYHQPVVLKLSGLEAYAVQLALLRYPWTGRDGIDAVLFHVQSILPSLAVSNESQLLPPAVVWEVDGVGEEE